MTKNTPDMQQVQSWNLCTLPDAANSGAFSCLQTSASSAGLVHTVNLTVPAKSMMFNGNYHFYLHLMDGHQNTYKGHSEPAGMLAMPEKCALDENAEHIYGPITYIQSGEFSIAWAHRQYDVRRITQAIQPAQIAGAVNWAYQLENGQTDALHGKFITDVTQRRVSELTR